VPQFAVYRNKNLHSCAVFPWLIDVQSELFDDLQSRVVIPLSHAPQLVNFPLAYLTPKVVFEGETYALMTPQLAGVARGNLGPHVGSLAPQAAAISRAIEFLLRGF
jgi:toxin CcdB